MNKKLLIICIHTCLCVLHTNKIKAQGVGLNSSGQAPHASALLDMEATNKGVLLPRMTSAQRDAISNPAAFLMIANTTTNCIEFWDAAGQSWISMGCGCTPPAAPVALAATSVSQTSFTANWNPVSGALTYFLDVSTDAGFTSLVPSYSNLDVTNASSYAVTGLTCDQTYYVRVRAGGTCGSSPDSNGITAVLASCIPSVTCGSQVFMAENLNVGTMINSSSGGQLQNNNGSTEKYCYNNNASNCTAYGGLYEWGEAMGYAASVNCDPCSPTSSPPAVQGICPTGWHIPSDLEWSRWEHCVETTIAPTGSTALATFQNNQGWRGESSAAGPGHKMKDNVTWNGSNASGFKAYPAGFRASGNGAFSGITEGSIWWSATQVDGSNAWDRNPYSGQYGIYRDSVGKTFGFSVRCLKD